MINQVLNRVLQSRIWRDTRGQDMVEYSLMAAFITVAVAAVFPPVGTDISVIFSKLTSVAEQVP